MKTHLFVAVLASVLTLCTAVLAQTPSEIESHIAAAKTAAGQDFRGTFVNLCLPGGAAPAGTRGAAPAGARGTGARGAATAPATPDRAGWYASPYKVFDNLY